MITQDAFTVSPGDWEFSLGPAVERAHQAFDDNGNVVTRPDTFQNAIAASAVHGLADDLDLSLTGLWAKLGDRQTGSEDGNGLGDVQLELRWRFHSGDAWHLAYLPRLVVPLGDKQNQTRLVPGQPYWSVDNSLVASRVDGRWASSVEGSLSVPFGDERKGNRWAVALNGALGYQLSPRVKIEGELLLNHQEFERDEAAWLSSLAVGAVMQLSPQLRMDAALVQGLHGQRADRLNVLVINFVLQL
ncbi:MAG: transporter [Chromatiales bacterium]|nr:transporter [Chromatiales bacterium]